MKRIKVLFILLFTSSITHAQYYGVDGLVIAAANITKHLVEDKKYKEIVKWQSYILSANTLIAAEITGLNALEKKIYEGYSKLDESVKSAELILLIINDAEDIYKTAKAIKKIGDGNLKIQAYTLDKQLFLLAEVAFIMNDYLIATKEGKKNLLNSGDRYYLLDFFYKRIEKLKRQSKNLLFEINSISKVILYDIKFDEASITDFTPLNEELKIIFNELFPKNLN